MLLDVGLPKLPRQFFNSRRFVTLLTTMMVTMMTMRIMTMVMMMMMMPEAEEEGQPSKWADPS